MCHFYGMLKDLKLLHNPPKHLNLLGKVSRDDEKNIVVIGSRNMSDYGKNVIKALVPGLVNEGFTIISGLAVGCDSFAQKTALDCGGRTIGVLGYGFDFVKKDSNVSFIEEVLKSEKGIVISPFERTRPPSKESYIFRNSVMAAIGKAVLVVEARRKSGVFYTVNFALDLGRTVMAVPGDVFCFNSQGVNSLIKEGAFLVDSLESILECL